MKKYIPFLLTVAAAALLVGCNKSAENTDVKSISVKASIGSMSKASYDGDKSAFEAGDALALFAWTGDKTAIPGELVVNNVINTLGTDGLWTPATQMLWDDMTTPHYFMAVSPARNVMSFTEDLFILNASAEKYQESDLLIATNVEGLVATDNPVELTFDHAMAKLTVNLKFRNQWTAQEDLPGDPNVEAKINAVFATAKQTASINYLEKSVTPEGDAYPMPLNKTANASWTSLIIPQEGFRTITIYLDGNDEWLGGNGTYVFTHSADIPLGSGKVTTVNLIVGRDQITLDEAAGGISITDWEAGEVIDNGEAQIPDYNFIEG